MNFFLKTINALTLLLLCGSIFASGPERSFRRNRSQQGNPLNPSHELVKEVIKNTNKTENSVEQLQYALENARTEILENLEKRGYYKYFRDLKEKSVSPQNLLVLAAKFDLYDTVQQLLGAGVFPGVELGFRVMFADTVYKAREGSVVLNSCYPQISRKMADFLVSYVSPFQNILSKVFSVPFAVDLVVREALAYYACFQIGGTFSLPYKSAFGIMKHSAGVAWRFLTV